MKKLEIVEAEYENKRRIMIIFSKRDLLVLFNGDMTDSNFILKDEEEYNRLQNKLSTYKQEDLFEFFYEREGVRIIFDNDNQDFFYFAM